MVVGSNSILGMNARGFVFYDTRRTTTGTPSASCKLLR